MKTTLRVRNWNKFQRFKYRNPNWIKLYVSLLDDLHWAELDGDTAKTLINTWLAASQNNGEIGCLKATAHRVRVPYERYLERMNILKASGNWFEEVSHEDQLIPNVEVLNSSPYPSPQEGQKGRRTSQASGAKTFDQVLSNIEAKYQKHNPAPE